MQQQKIQNERSHKTCARAKGSQKSCVRAEGLQKYQESCVEFEQHNLSKHNDAIVQPLVEDPVDDGRIPAEARARMIPHLVNLPSWRK